MKRIAFLTTLIMAALLPLAALAAQVGTFTAVRGGVDIGGAGQAARLVKVGDPVDEGDVVRTKSNAKAEITFTDDNILRMAEKSRIVISEYVATQESLTAKLTLSRGKVQNIVRRTSRIFGLIKKNRFEVHTPTAVVGVRGTNFFTYYQQGVSGAAFLEGEGYGYNPKIPDQVELVTTGQALLVASPEAAPTTRDAASPEMERNINDTAPPDGADDEVEDGQDDGDTGHNQDGADPSPATAQPAVAAGDANAELLDLTNVVVDPSPAGQEVGEQIVAQPVTTADPLPAEAIIYLDDNVLTTPILADNPEPTAGTGTDEPLPNTFSSDPFSGGLFAQAPGTSYTGEFERLDPSASGGTSGYVGYNAHYGYEYFIGEGVAGGAAPPFLRFGNYNASDYQGTREDKLFAPDGKIFDTSDHFARYYGEWLPGELTAADFNDPLARSWPTTPVGATWEQRRVDSWASNLILETGVFDGLFYGSDDLWSATAAQKATFNITGSFSNSYATSGSQLFRTTLKSSGIGSGATFTGELGGVFAAVAAKLSGTFYGIYIAPDQSGGILTGQIDYSSINNFLVAGEFMAEGTIFPTMLTADAGLTPDLLWANLDEGIAGSWLSGSFGSQDSRFGSSLGMGKTTSLRGHNDWGLFSLAFGYDNHLVNPGGATSATAMLSGVADFGTHAAIGGVTPDSGLFMTAPLTVSLDDPAATLLHADLTGEYLTYTQMGELGGQLTGAYDELGGWQGIAAGFWRNGRTLAFNGEVDGGLFRTVENISGSYDDSVYPDPPTLVYYYYYEAGLDQGQSWEQDYATGIITTKDYNPDGTIAIQTDDNGVLTQSTGAFAPGTLAEELTGWIPAGAPGHYSESTIALREGGHFSAIMGSVDDLWTADRTTPAATHLLGELGDDSAKTSGPVLVSAQVHSANPYQQNNTIWDQGDPTNPVDGNGSYMGLLSGLRGADSSINLTMQGLYVDPTGNVGFVTGKINGAADNLSKSWSGDGTLYPIELINGSTLAPAQFYRMAEGGIVRESREMNIFNGTTAGGWFLDYGATPATLGGYITWTGYNFTQLSVADSAITPAWALGVQSAQYSGSYDSSSMSDHWRSFYEVMTMNGDQWQAVGQSTPNPIGWDGSEVGTVDTTGHWANGEIGGKGAAAWVSIDTAMTGLAGTELRGTFDPTNTTWQMAAAWASIDTNTFLGLTTTAAGREALAQLNIPCIEVGRASLSGSSAVFSDVHINDATFFAYSTGAEPTIWGSGDVGGAYASLPGSGDTVNLTGNGLSAQFKVNNWGGTTWNAAVMGNGTYSGTGGMAGKPVDFTGYAAGTQAGGTTGAFTGTAAGIVTPAGIGPQ